MDEALMSSWITGLIVAAVIVVAAAALLLAILASARRILRLAGDALEAVEEIKENTHAVWALDTTNKVGGQILERAESIAEHGAAIVQTLEPAGDKTDVA